MRENYFHNINPRTQRMLLKPCSPTFTQQLKTKAQSTDIVDATVWTDGSLRTFSKGKKAYSAVYFGDNDPCNTSFRTVGRPSVFNAEAQAIEASLYCLSYSNTTIVSDSKSMTSTIKKLRNLVANSLILLPEDPSFEQVKQFVVQVMYK